MTLLKLSNFSLFELSEIDEFCSAAALASAGTDLCEFYRSEYLDFFFAQLSAVDEFKPLAFALISDLDSESNDDVYFRFGYVRQFIKNVAFELATRQECGFDFLDNALVSDVGHGGKRLGSGRKKQSPTKQLRVDSDLSDIFKTLSDVYRVSDQDQKLVLVERLLTLSSLDCDIISK